LRVKNIFMPANPHFSLPAFHPSTRRKSPQTVTRVSPVGPPQNPQPAAPRFTRNRNFQSHRRTNLTSVYSSICYSHFHRTV